MTPDDIGRRLEAMPPIGAHWRWASLIGIGCSLDGFTTLVVAVAMTVLVSSLHFEFSQIGLLISAGFIGMFVGALCGGALSERLGRRTVFAACVALFGALSLVAAGAWNFETLFWLRLVQGVGLGGAVPVGAALVAELLPARARGRTFSFAFALLFSIGYVLAPLFGFVFIQLLGPEAGWRALFVFAGLALPFGIALRFALPESPRWLASRGRTAEAEAIVARLEAGAAAHGLTLQRDSGGVTSRAPNARLGEIFSGEHRARLLLVWALFFAIYFVQYGLTGWLPTLYVKMAHLTPSFALLLALVNGLATLAAAVVFALTVDRVGRKAWFGIGFGLSVAGLVAALATLGGLACGQWQRFFAATLVTAAGGSVNSGLIYLYAPELFPTRMRSWATSTGLFCMRGMRPRSSRVKFSAPVLDSMKMLVSVRWPSWRKEKGTVRLRLSRERMATWSQVGFSMFS